MLAHAALLVLLPSVAAAPLPRGDESIFADGFEDSARFTGTNVVGMEMAYQVCDQPGGPVEGTNYPRHDERLVDYYADKGATAIRFLFSWECAQPQLFGAIPSSFTANHALYFANYQRIVAYATNVRGMRVIVEPWNTNASGGAGGARYRGQLVGTAAVPTAAFADFWSRMANVFRTNPRVSYGLINEPNDMSTMSWFASAQAAITAIRATGSTQRIYVPGNGYTAASTWTANFYDTGVPQRSNAYGWLNANGPGQPLNDPANDIVAEVHTYLDPDEGGSSSQITSIDAARQHLAVVVGEARLRGYRVWLGEIGLYAGEAIGPAAWDDFAAYFASEPVLVGWTWWAGGDPNGWWPDVAANGGGHYAITPTSAATYTGDTVNMDMIESDF